MLSRRVAFRIHADWGTNATDPDTWIAKSSTSHRHLSDLWRMLSRREEFRIHADWARTPQPPTPGFPRHCQVMAKSWPRVRAFRVVGLLSIQTPTPGPLPNIDTLQSFSYCRPSICTDGDSCMLVKAASSKISCTTCCAIKIYPSFKDYKICL
jgi:hypothetical protein